MLKRSVDISLSGLLLAASLPILAFAAILIKLDSAGPVIFRQARTGRGFKRFQLLKLRTMCVGAEGSPFTLGADPRITGAGRWLRKFKLDELPQLWNVLRGDMSLVGPRPVVPELTAEFHQAYARLLEVRPGLSDPATLKYCRETELLTLVPEPLRYFKTVVTPDKLRISQAYLDCANLWSDLAVMTRTAWVLLAPRGQFRTGKEASVRPRSASRFFSFRDSVRRRRMQARIDGALRRWGGNGRGGVKRSSRLPASFTCVRRNPTVLCYRCVAGHHSLSVGGCYDGSRKSEANHLRGLARRP